MLKPKVTNSQTMTKTTPSLVITLWPKQHLRWLSLGEIINDTVPFTTSAAEDIKPRPLSTAGCCHLAMLMAKATGHLFWQLWWWLQPFCGNVSWLQSYKPRNWFINTVDQHSTLPAVGRARQKLNENLSSKTRCNMQFCYITHTNFSICKLIVTTQLRRRVTQ